MSTGDTLVCCNAVGRTFGTGTSAVVAVHDVTCEVTVGMHLAITGSSGSGKSTLLHLMAGLDAPTVGGVSWPAFGGSNHLRPGPVAVIFQGSSLVPALDVTENVALTAVLAGTPKADADALAGQALERLGLAALARRLPEELSGGQAQRVAVARALAGTPRLILADEPTGQLDQHSANDVVSCLLEAAEELGATLVVTTHDLGVADRLQQHWKMRDGCLVQGAVVSAW